MKKKFILIIPHSLTVVFALLPHERAPLAHRVVALAVLAPDPQDVEEGRRGAQAVPAVDLSVQILKCSSASCTCSVVKQNE